MGRPRLKENTGFCINGCWKWIHCRGLCKLCYRQLNYEEHERDRRGAIKTEQLPIGTKYINSNGYVMIKIANHRGKSHKGNWTLEHRAKMEKLLGRKLKRYEHIHHKSGVKHDNRSKNLELWITRQPKGQRIRDLVKFANWILEKYGDYSWNNLSLVLK